MSQVKIVPVPQAFTPAPGDAWRATPNMRLCITTDTESTTFASIAATLRQATGFPCPIVTEPARSTDISWKLAPVRTLTSQTSSPETYVIISSTAGVTVIGASPVAWLRATATLCQCLATGTLEAGRLLDYPKLAERRVLVDAGRKFITKEWFITMLHELAFLKINTLQLHFADRLGFHIACDTDPSLTSPDYLTKADVRDLLAEANRCGITIVPSLDVPGHADHILTVHPELGQRDVAGGRATDALDLTDPAVTRYVFALITEYLDLFADCPSFHFGGDEYMEFDCPPFEHQYAPVLNAYAKEHLGSETTWKDVWANWLNQVAELIHAHGVEPRIFNDGLCWDVRGIHGAPQQIRMHSYIGVDYWCQAELNPAIATVAELQAQGLTRLYNLNSPFFYYALRHPDSAADHRPLHRFDFPEQAANIYANWTPGNFQANDLPDDDPRILGACLSMWTDNPTVATESTMAQDIQPELAVFASKTWNVDTNHQYTYPQFQSIVQSVGHSPGYPF